MFSKLMGFEPHYELKHEWSTVKCSLYEPSCQLRPRCKDVSSIRVTRSGLCSV